MDYIDNVYNVLHIYHSFCEYLELKPNAEKHRIIARMRAFYINENVNPINWNENIQLLSIHEQTRELFRTFLTIYVIKNPDLRVYRQEIINMQFNTPLFEEGFELFNDYCLK